LGLKGLLAAGCFLLTAILATVYVLFSGALHALDLRIMDIILKGAPAEAKHSRITVVEIDDASLEAFGQWPWPRYRLAEMLEEIAAAGPAVVGINIRFPERDRTSPIIWQQTLEEEYGYRVDTSTLPLKFVDNDVRLAEALAAGSHVLGYDFLFEKKILQSQKCNIEKVTILSRSPQDPHSSFLKLHRASDVLCNYEVLGQSADRSGFLNGSVDRDGMMRRLPLLIEWRQQAYPSFALAVVMEYLDHDKLVQHASSFNTPVFSLLQKRFKVDSRGRYILRPLKLQQEITVSALEVLKGKVEAADFKDRIVLVGLGASGLGQTFPTVFSTGASLLEIHKYSIETLLSETMTVRPAYFHNVEITLSLVLMLLVVAAVGVLPPLWSTLFTGAVITAITALTVSFYSTYGYLFSPLLPTVVLAANCILSLLLRFHYFQAVAGKEVRLAHDQLQSSRHSLEAILRTIPDIVFRLDQEARIIYISQAVTAYGLEPEDLLGRPVFELVDPEDQDRVRYRINERRTESRATRDLELFLDFGLEYKGQKRTFSLSSQGIYTNDGADEKIFLGTQGILKDITEKKQLERELLQAQKMEVVGNLAAGIAHDLNNILSGLVSYPDLLMREVGRESPLYDKIAIIQKSGKRAAAIVQDLLTMARRNVDKSEICNLNDIIKDYLESVEFRQMQAEYPHIAVELRLADDLFNIKGSAVHLSKVVMNILQNSFEAMEYEGRILLQTRNVRLDRPLHGYETIDRGEYVYLVIKDEGTGISKEDLARVFEPFYTKKSLGRSGTGLGMSVIWATVKDHDGYIDIESQKGGGTTLRIYLPSTREGLDHRSLESDSAHQGGDERILIVDDIREQRDIGRSMLVSVGYTVSTVSSGEEAAAYVADNPVDLLVLDMIMPGGWDGLQTFRRCRKLAPHLKAVITSGYSESERVYEIRKMGGGRYVQKPFSMNELLEAVREELDKD